MPGRRGESDDRAVTALDHPVDHLNGKEGVEGGLFARLERRPVTPEVAGSSPVAPVKALQISICI